MPGDAPANRETIDRFYTALAARDHETISGCYRPEARFSDPVFGELRGDEVRAQARAVLRRSAGS